ncbi:MAG: 3-isopropylmalate dehydrogenase [Bacteroidales bacterium]
MEKKIAVLPGDGIGPEVMEQALRTLKAIEKKYDFKFTYQDGLIGAVAIDETGSALPDETIKICREADAVMLGAVGHPRFDNDPNAKVRPEQGLLRIRKELGLFANIRPVATYPLLYKTSPLKEELIKDVDFVVYRELTGGIYFGEKGRNDDGTEAYDHCVYSANEIKRIAELAFNTAMLRGNKLTLVDKANVLETSRLWRDTVKKMAPLFPDVNVDFMFVDAAAMKIIQNPGYFDVILTENMFGDIITDEASVITGSIGMLPSASVGLNSALFEPIHGSYPEGAGKNIANPFGTILSAALLLEHFEMLDAARDIRNVVDKALQEGIVTIDINPGRYFSTSEVGDFVVDNL